MQPVRFCIVRHGETDWNTQRRLQGHIDIGLNPVGHRQAAAAAQGLVGLHFDAFLASDLLRTRETAAAITAVLGIKPHLEPDLRERHYGVFQGRTADEVAIHFPEAYAAYKSRDEHYEFGDGESLHDFAHRISSTMTRLAETHAGQTVLLVAHGGVLDVIYRRAMGRDLSGPRDFPIPNAALNWISVGPNGWQVELWADQRHLDNALDELQ
ncbi:MAG TPA: histidine phosphatase family protein [Rhodocyclaceae bacterium]